jgi:UDP-N-acetylmuramoyl-L-alanyl-D-glutamate--2,6-diaminopimelate ligase
MLARSPRMRTGARVVVVYAIRGSRGVDINRRNALSLADLAAEHGVDQLIVTAAADVAGPRDRPAGDEVDATRQAFAARRQSIDWFDTLEKGSAAALQATGPGDLIVLVGAQGMNEGQALLSSADAAARTGSTCRS